MLPNSPPGPPYPHIPPRPSELEQVADMLAFQDHQKGDQRPKRLLRLFTYRINSALSGSTDFRTDVTPDCWLIRSVYYDEQTDFAFRPTWSQPGMQVDMLFPLIAYLGAGPGLSTGDRDRYILPGTANNLHLSWPNGPPNGTVDFIIAALIGIDPAYIL